MLSSTLVSGGQYIAALYAFFHLSRMRVKYCLW